MTNSNFNSPLAIGGVGGSGTRVFREVAVAAGYNMLAAPWLVRVLWRNTQHDNLLLRKYFYPRWMQGYLEDSLSPANRRKMRRHFQWLLWLNGPTGYGRGNWGWKNPNTMFFLPFLQELYPSMRYIHVVRDGRDIAFNETMTQVNPGNRCLFTDDELALPDHLRNSVFWQRCNQRIESWASSQPEGVVYRSRFEDLCLRPQEEVPRICNFLGVENVQDVIKQLDGKIHQPKSLQRWKRQDPRLLAEVEELLQDDLQRYHYLSPVG